MNNHFSKNVFINCPFDDEYKHLLRPLLFCILKLGFTPRIALERFDSTEVRLSKIGELIESSKYSIHDFSRIRSRKKKEYYRMNMPFELGLDLGCKNYSSAKLLKSKKIMILEAERYSIQKALSDLSFADCKCHKGDAEELVTEIRNWFYENGHKRLPGGSIIWNDYNIFWSNFYEVKTKNGYSPKDIDRLPVPEFMDHMHQWIISS